jgi:hypothetical protein
VGGGVDGAGALVSFAFVVLGSSGTGSGRLVSVTAGVEGRDVDAVAFRSDVVLVAAGLLSLEVCAVLEAVLRGTRGVCVRLAVRIDVATDAKVLAGGGGFDAGGAGEGVFGPFWAHDAARGKPASSSAFFVTVLVRVSVAFMVCFLKIDN